MPKTLKVLIPAVLALLITALCGLVLALQVGQAAAARELLDPGVVVRYLLPTTRLLVNLTLAISLGTLVFMLWAVSPTSKLWQQLADVAATAAAALTISAAAVLLLTFLDVSGKPFSADWQFGAVLGHFISNIELGTLWLYTLLFAAAATVSLYAIRGRKLLLLPLTLLVLVFFPLAAQGHAAGASGHSLAVNAMFLHIAGAAVWVGALVALFIASCLVTRTKIFDLADRYSTLALVAALLVAFSGVVSAVIRCENVSDLVLTGYGQLVLLKTFALLVLLGFGALQRLRWLRQLRREFNSARYGKLLLAELLVMGVASGFAAGLGRTQTPNAITPARELDADISPAEYLTGDKLPPEITPEVFFTAWKFDLLWAAVSVGGIIVYLYGVYLLARRGDKWQPGRAISWCVGMLILGYVTNGFFNVYEAYVFSVHMLGHMFLTMLIPLLLVLGAPVTLLLRAAAKRRDNSWGLREWVLWLTETPYARVVTNPLVAALIFAGSLWVFYFTPVLRWAMSSHLGHQWMIIHFLLSGYFFALCLVGIDPLPKRASYPLRVIILLATMGAHAFFGVTIMSGTGLLAADWFGAMGRVWGDAPLTDQRSGGAIAWGIGEIPTLLLMLVVSVQWARADEKEQRRKDRAADRDGDAELAAYNEMLQARARRS